MGLACTKQASYIMKNRLSSKFKFPQNRSLQKLREDTILIKYQSIKKHGNKKIYFPYMGPNGDYQINWLNVGEIKLGKSYKKSRMNHREN